MLLSDPPSAKDKLVGEQAKLDRSLLSAWMNFADGAWSWDTLIEDTDGDRRPDKTVAEVLEEVEQVRLGSRNVKAVSDARQRLWILGMR